MAKDLGFTPSTIPGITKNPIKPAINTKPQHYDVSTQKMGQIQKEVDTQIGKLNKPDFKTNTSTQTNMQGKSTRKNTATMGNGGNRVPPYNAGGTSDKDDNKRRPRVNAEPRRYGIEERDSTPIDFKSEAFSSSFTNPYVQGDFQYDPLINILKLSVNLAEITPCGTTGSKAEANFDDIYSAIITLMARESNASTTNLFTKSNLKVYFNTIWKLVNYFYEVDTILAWNPPAGEYNGTLNAMKELFANPAMLESKVDLGNKLRNYYIPSEFIKLSAWFNQTYKTGPLSDSKLFRWNTPKFAAAIKDNSVTAYIAEITATRALLNAASDSSTALTANTTAFMSAALSKYANFGQINHQGLPLSTNKAVHDIKAYDIFINQSSKYTNKNAAEKLFPENTNKQRSFCTHREPNNLDVLTLGLQGTFSTAIGTQYSGLLTEGTVGVSIDGTVRNINKLVVYNNGTTLNIYARDTFKHRIFNDFHGVDMFIATAEEVSINPSHTQLIYVDAASVMDVTVRKLQHQLFGNIGR